MEYLLLSWSRIPTILICFTIFLFNELNAQTNHRKNMKYDKTSRIPVVMFDIKTIKYTGTPENAARQYLIENKDLLGLKENIPDLDVIKVKESPAGFHILFQQVYKGIPVDGATILVSTNKENRIRAIINNYQTIIDLNTIPNINGTQALEIAYKSISYYQSEDILKSNNELIIFSNDDDGYQLVWRNYVQPKSTGEIWCILIDAHNS